MNLIVRIFETWTWIRAASRALALTLIFATALAIATPSQAQGGPFGLGVVIGDPTAITGKYMFDNVQAMDFGLSFDLSRWFLLYGDYQHHFPGAFGRANAFFAHTTPYVGVGGLLVFSNREAWETRRWRYFSETSDSRMALGLRIPLGMEWRPPNVPIGVFLELVPGILIVPATYGYFQGGLGIRYFF